MSDNVARFAPVIKTGAFGQKVVEMKITDGATWVQLCDYVAVKRERDNITRERDSWIKDVADTLARLRVQEARAEAAEKRCDKLAELLRDIKQMTYVDVVAAKRIEFALSSLDAADEPVRGVEYADCALRATRQQKQKRAEEAAKRMGAWLVRWANGAEDMSDSCAIDIAGESLIADFPEFCPQPEVRNKIGEYYVDGSSVFKQIAINGSEHLATCEDAVQARAVCAALNAKPGGVA